MVLADHGIKGGGQGREKEYEEDFNHSLASTTHDAPTCHISAKSNDPQFFVFGIEPNL